MIDTKEAVGDSCAVPCRLSMDELRGADGLEKAETEDMIGLVAEIPDLWDVCLAGWENDSQSSRFGEEGGQEPFIEGVKKLTTKPVVGVGRYTSPDRMVSIVKKGIVDLIGCARPSIADPFLPRKVAEGRLEDIRECIGCNICVSGDFTMSPIRCTQNPTMGEEWRRGWHPEFIRPKESEKPVLIVGAGPAGLEAAQALGKRGYDVTLAEQSRELGGRVARECRLPGLAAWGRVRDYRAEQLRKLPNVALYLESQLDAETVLEFGCPRVVLTPDDLMEGRLPEGTRVVVWDDDHYYMGGVLAELLADKGFTVTYMTPASEACTWSRNTMEQPFVQARMLEKGIAIEAFRTLTVFPRAPSRCHASIPAGSRSWRPMRWFSSPAEHRRARSRPIYCGNRTAGRTPVLEAVEPSATRSRRRPSPMPSTPGERYAEGLDGAAVPMDEVPFKREIAELID
ncbi:Trimethylamine dehydrogenase [Geodia barretti]|uniref:Trimethylamine dehydrogenase n=1 Tax=Geodia barretti TaxID=519541 RepID=A0AA35R902_GEOBA|nr:Trimethylamine dehydrogenase [Geodia barretti]